MTDAPVPRTGHIFISYARADGSEFAGRLHDDLEASGFNTWLDIRDIPAGASWHDRIEQAVRSARAILVVMTPGAIASKAVMNEWLEARGRYVPTIPLIVKLCQIPMGLNDLQFIDFHRDYQFGLEALKPILTNLKETYLEQLKKEQATLKLALKTADDPENVQIKLDYLDLIIELLIREPLPPEQIKAEEEAIKASIRKAVEQPTSPIEPPNETELRVIGSRPLGAVRFFKDRINERGYLAQWLTAEPKRVVSIIGGGGRGKTALVKKIIYDLKQTPTENLKGILYLDLSDSKVGDFVLERLFLGCAEMIGGTGQLDLNNIWTNKELSDDDKLERLIKILLGGFYITILDNMETLLDPLGEITDKGLMQFLKKVFEGEAVSISVLITSRHEMALASEPDYIPAYGRVELEEGLPEQDAIEFLKMYDPSGRRFEKIDQADLSYIVERLFRNPRALQIFAGVADEQRQLPLREIVDSFPDSEEELVRKGYRRLDKYAQRVVEALAVFNQPVPVEAVKFLLQPFIPGVNLDLIIRRLRRINMIEEYKGLLSLNALDRDYIYSQLPEEAEQGE